MSDFKKNVGRALRFVGSEGLADEDAQVVAEVLEQARKLAELVLAETAVSADARTVAEDLLERLRSDTFGMS
jgi:hypothetical protein